MSELDPVAVKAVRMLSRLARVLERSTDELNLAHYRVLSAIADGNERASRIAANLSLGKPTVSANVDSLVNRGLLRRQPADDDQRASVLTLTAAGRDTLARVERAMVDALVDFGGGSPLFAALAGTGVRAAVADNAAVPGGSPVPPRAQ